jgi:hypothetical protein
VDYTTRSPKVSDSNFILPTAIKFVKVISAVFFEASVLLNKEGNGIKMSRI